MKSRTAFTKCWQIYSPLLRSSFCRLRPLAGKLCTGHASAICLPMQQTLLAPDWPPASSPAWLSLPGRRCSQSVLRHRPAQRQCQNAECGEDWDALAPPRVPAAAIRSPRSHAQLRVQSVSRILSSGVQQCTEWVAVIGAENRVVGRHADAGSRGDQDYSIRLSSSIRGGHPGCSVELVNGDIRAGWVAGPELPLATTVTND